MTQEATPSTEPEIVVAIPCYNEAVTIGKVISDFREELPEVEILVFDNNSIDDSRKIAEAAGAIVHSTRKQGKGYVLQAIFDIVSADALVLVDGDDTYDARDVHVLLELVISGESDMVVGNRLPNARDESMRAHRHIGNRLIVRAINMMFGTRYQDILSGYRVFSRRFVQTVPLLTPGFETETEMTLQALEEGMIIDEIPIRYRSRPEDSHSKLNPIRDGYRIILTAAMLLRDHNPLRLFGLIALIFFILGFALVVLALLTLSGRLEMNVQVLFTGILLLLPMGALSFAIGLILNAVNTRFRQLKQIFQRNK
jgi:glycosyltransferase involved in cell wall biosynthesis